MENGFGLNSVPQKKGETVLKKEIISHIQRHKIEWLKVMSYLLIKKMNSIKQVY